jgi:hypothetical protein
MLNGDEKEFQIMDCLHLLVGSHGYGGPEAYYTVCIVLCEIIGRVQILHLGSLLPAHAAKSFWLTDSSCRSTRGWDIDRVRFSIHRRATTRLVCRR